MAEIPASHRDLLQSPVATLATIGPDGRPQLSEVWFVAEGDTVRISLNTTRQKTKNLQRNPACNLFILDLARPSRYLELRGDARIEPDDDYVFAAKVNEKYGADVRSHDRPGQSRVVVTIDPARVNAVDMAAQTVRFFRRRAGIPVTAARRGYTLVDSGGEVFPFGPGA